MPLPLFRKFLQLRKSSQPKPILEIVRATRVLQKRKISAVLIVEKNQLTDRSILAEEIISKLLACPQRIVKLSFTGIEKINQPLPFPRKVCRKDFSNQELGCLGLSQNSGAVVISISGGGEVAIVYQNSIRRSISSPDLHSLLLFLLTRDGAGAVSPRYLIVKKA
jgi:hypothetical protein